MKSPKLVIAACGGVLLVAAAYFGARSAFAVGIPAREALTYAGVLEDANGPINARKNIALEVYDAVTAGTKRCEVASQPYDLSGGRFEIPLPDACTAAVAANADLWVEILVDGAPTGRAKLGAVPFAVESRRASESAGSLKNELGWKSVYGSALAGCARLGALPPNAGMVVPRTADTCTTVCAAQPLKTCKGTVAVQLDDISSAPTAGQSVGRYYDYACDNPSAGTTPVGKASPYGALFGFCCCT